MIQILYPSQFSVILLKISLFFIVGFCFSANAQTPLGIYEFTGTPSETNPLNEVTAQPSYANFSKFTRHTPYVSFASGNDVFNTENWEMLFTNDDYLEFTITAKTGYALHLTSISLDKSHSTNGPQNIRIAHNASGNFTTNYLDDITENTSLTWNFADITTPLRSSITFRIFGWNAPAETGTLRVDNVKLIGSIIPNALINEFHYFNISEANMGFVEVIAPKDFTHLFEVAITLYAADGNGYFSTPLSNFTTKPAGTTDNKQIYYLDLPEGYVSDLKALSLSYGTNVLQFISFNNTVTAINGAANKLTSRNIGVSGKPTDGNQKSIYLPVIYSEINTSLNDADNFVYAKYERNVNTKGIPNDDAAILPITLNFFSAKPVAQGIELHWETGSEENNSHFEVERSLDAQHFSIISQMKSKGTVSGNSYYTYLDRVEFSGTRYYRLKQVDLDGTSTYSPVVPVTNQWFAPLFQAYPNPVTDYLQLKLPADKVIASMKLFDLQGRQIRQQSINAANYAVDVRNLTAGKYILQVVQGKQKWTFPFFKY